MSRYDKQGMSLGMLRTSMGFPDDALPLWANTAAKRLIDMGVSVSRIKEILTEMEINRRNKVREQFGSKVPVTEFDEHLADLLNRFGVKDA